MKLNIVPARTGILWVKLGVQTFLRQPLALAGLFFMYLATVVVVLQLGILGAVIGGMLVPAATLGLMAATAEASRGRFPMPSVLISAFRAGKQQARAMLVLGVLYAIGSLVASVLGGLILGDATPVASPDAAATAEIDGRLLLALLLRVPLIVLFWHAPALVHWYGVSPVKSLFFSGVACLRNFSALMLFILTWVAVLTGVGTVIGTLGLMLGGEAGLRAVALPTVLLVIVMATTSLYFTFRDSFTPTSAGEQQIPGGDDPAS